MTKNRPSKQNRHYSFENRRRIQFKKQMVALGWWWIRRSGNNAPDRPNVQLSIGDIANHVGGCPHTFQIQGKIAVGSPGMVIYTWKRSDGTGDERQRVSIRRAGETVVVSDTWQLNQDGIYTLQLMVLEPVQQYSEEARFTLRCR